VVILNGDALMFIANYDNYWDLEKGSPMTYMVSQSPGGHRANQA
jgi:hypothetical protein